jgi:hypothetical protein
MQTFALFLVFLALAGYSLLARYALVTTCKILDALYRRLTKS